MYGTLMTVNIVVCVECAEQWLSIHSRVFCQSWKFPKPCR